jgi:hypothetical protein
VIPVGSIFKVELNASTPPCIVEIIASAILTFLFCSNAFLFNSSERFKYSFSVINPCSNEFFKAICCNSAFCSWKFLTLEVIVLPKAANSSIRCFAPSTSSANASCSDCRNLLSLASLASASSSYDSIRSTVPS